MQLAVEGKIGDPDYIDFVMSQRFGLNWREYDCVRMTKFQYMLGYEAKRDQKENEKAIKNANRPRTRR